MRLAHWLHSSFRSAYLTSRRGLQGVPRHGAARRSGSSFPETYIFFSNRLIRALENQCLSDTGILFLVGIGQGCPWCSENPVVLNLLYLST